jgi:hypothetical protein
MYLQSVIALNSKLFMILIGHIEVREDEAKEYGLYGGTDHGHMEPWMR